MSEPTKRERPALPEIADEPGWEDRFQRGLQRALSTPPKHRGKPAHSIRKRAEAKKTDE